MAGRAPPPGRARQEPGVHVPEKGQHRRQPPCPAPVGAAREEGGVRNPGCGVSSRPRQRDAADKGIPSTGLNLQIPCLARLAL